MKPVSVTAVGLGHATMKMEDRPSNTLFHVISNVLKDRKKAQGHSIDRVIDYLRE
jgi:hypothetical protein